jgi:hypothetical protein
VSARSIASAQAAVDAWNSAHPIGTPVMRYRLVEPLREGTATVTRSLAYVADAGYPVVFVAGVLGYVTLDSVVPIEELRPLEADGR